MTDKEECYRCSLGTDDPFFVEAVHRCRWVDAGGHISEELFSICTRCLELFEDDDGPWYREEGAEI